MNEPVWEGAADFLCRFWWILLIVIVLGLTLYFTRGYWLPLLGI